MKSIYLVMASALLVGTAMPVLAQNTSTISQSDGANSADVGQVINGLTSNASAIEQIGSNTAAVRQSGSAGFAVSNTSRVKQDGTGNTASVNQAGSAGGDNDSGGVLFGSDILQVGTSNGAVVNQSAINTGDNSSSVTQDGDANSAGVLQIANTADNGVQGDSDVDNSSVVKQNGSRNSASVNQTSNDTVVNVSLIDQFGGTDNIAGTTQSGTGATSNASSTTQNGTANQAYVTQSGAGVVNSSTVTQNATGSFAVVNQTSN